MSRRGRQPGRTHALTHSRTHALTHSLAGEDSLDALSLLYYTSQSASGFLLLAVISTEAIAMWSDPLVTGVSDAAPGMWITLAM